MGFGPDEAVWLDRLEVEFDNIRAALAFSLADPASAEPGLRMASGLRQNLGFADLLDADPRGARRHFLDSLDTARITGVKLYVHAVLLGLALSAAADSDPAVADTSLGPPTNDMGRTDELSRPWGLARPGPALPGNEWAVRPIPGAPDGAARPLP